MKKAIGFSILFLFSLFLHAQTLFPSIGLNSLPANNTPICVPPTYTGDYDFLNGYDVGDTVPDFTLFTKQGQPVNLQNILQNGKPVLLVAGSLTCFVFRDQMAHLNQIAIDYSQDIEIFIIYTIEAHPITDFSPYSGYVWVTNQNHQDGILHRQPNTYGKRKALVDTLLQHMTIIPEILIDGPCNEWWHNYGPAPNNAYLITPTGQVFAKHGWFNKAPSNMSADIDSLLGNGGGGGPGPVNGTFIFEYIDDSVATATVGEIVTIKGNITNTTGKSVELDIIRNENLMPGMWASAICTDICLPTHIDTATLFLYADSSQSFIMYFYTDSVPSSGSTEIHFVNKNNSNNFISANFKTITELTNVEVGSSVKKKYRLLTTNPVRKGKVIRLKIDENFIRKVNLVDITGRVVLSSDATAEVQFNSTLLKSGMFFIVFTGENGDLVGVEKVVVVE